MSPDYGNVDHNTPTADERGGCDRQDTKSASQLQQAPFLRRGNLQAIGRLCDP
jgi:hypothetical protein